MKKTIKITDKQILDWLEKRDVAIEQIDYEVFAFYAGGVFGKLRDIVKAEIIKEKSKKE